MTTTERIEALLRVVEQDAYWRGWSDAMAHLRSTAFNSADLKRGGTSSFILSRMNGAGMSGAEIILRCPEINQRTVRTALRRLRIAGSIEQRDGLWFKIETQK